MNVNKGAGSVVPKAFMTDLEVDFVSLVDKGANKRRFALFKSEKGVAEEGKTEPTDVEKYGYDPCLPVYGSDFKAAVEAIRTQEELEKNRCTMDEYFYLLRQVMKGVLEDESVKDKPAGLKKAIDQFKDAAVELFKGLPIQKAAELLGGEGGSMAGKTQNGQATDVTKGAGGAAAGGGVSQNGQPEGKNRPGDSTTVEGVGKEKGSAKAKYQKDATLALLEKKKGELKDMAAQNGKMDEEKKKKFSKCIEEVAELEADLVEIEKAVGDRSAGAPATGEDTVAKNGEAATTAPDHATAGAQENGAAGVSEVSKTETTPVKKDGLADVGAGNTSTTPAVTAHVANVNEANGDLSKVFESFKKTMEVSLEGVVGPVKELLSKMDERLKKVEKSASDTASVTKMAGLSNADLDFDTAGEKNRNDLQKSDDAAWRGELDSFGGMKKPRANGKA